ncbi:hypothetical protein TWF281_002347 [Arthrobotrys megalospora]
MWLRNNPKLRLLTALIIIFSSSHVSAAGNLQRRAPLPEPTGGANEKTPTWGSNPGRSFAFPNTPYTPQTGMNTHDTSRNSASYFAPSDSSNQQAGRTSNRSPFFENSYSRYISPDTSGYDSPEQLDDYVLDTEPDELLYPKQRRKEPFTVNPGLILQQYAKPRDRGITLGTAMKALGIRNPEVDPSTISPFIDIRKTPPTSGQTTPRYDLSGSVTPVSLSGQGTSRWGSPLARNRFTVIDPISVASMGDDEGNVEEEEEEEPMVDVPVFEPAKGYPGLEFTGPRKVNPVEVDTGTMSLLATEKEIATVPKIPTFESVPQDTNDPLYAKAFVMTPGGAASASVKVNAIVDENNDMILALQYEYFNPNPSKWIVDEQYGGVLRLAGTPYFVYLCHIPGKKVGFRLGDWNALGTVSQTCTGEATNRFFYTGWDVVPSKPKPGLPATAAEKEVQFNHRILKSLNKEGYFTSKFPTEALDYLWDIRTRDGKDVGIKLPKYIQVTTLPASQVKMVVGAGMSEQRPFWFYVGDVVPTGNKVLKGWTPSDIMKGDPIQLQSSVPEVYPMSWFLTEVEPGVDHFRSKHKFGAWVIMASLESFPKPGVWAYNATRNRIYKWGTKRFLYTCSNQDIGGEFLLSGVYKDALKDCKHKDWIYPIHPLIGDRIGSHGQVAVSLGRGLLWVSPDPKWTTPGYAYNDKGAPLLARLMTLGKPDYSGMTKKQAAEAKEYREQATMIIEAFVVDIKKGVPYVQ